MTMTETKRGSRKAATTKTPTKARKSALAKTPRTRVKAEPQQTGPVPVAGSKNRYTYQSVSPQEAMSLASLAHGLELDFGNDEKAMRRYRTRLYAINKEYSGKWRFRTIRENSILMIWRLAY
jgi:hypothetical protein